MKSVEASLVVDGEPGGVDAALQLDILTIGYLQDEATYSGRTPRTPPPRFESPNKGRLTYRDFVV